MNELLKDVLYGPLGWKIACAVVALVGILLVVALMDGPWTRGKAITKRVSPRRKLEGPHTDSSSRLEQEEQES